MVGFLLEAVSMCILCLLKVDLRAKNPYPIKKTIPNQVIYVMKKGNVSKNFPRPLTPATMSKASIKEQVKATTKTDSFKSPRLRT